MLRNLRLGNKLGIGFILVLVLTASITGIGLFYLNRVADATKQMYEHPYAIQLEISKVENYIVGIDRAVTAILGTRDVSVMEENAEHIAELEEQIMASFDIICDRFLGDRQLLEETRTAILEWQEIREELLGQQKRGFIIPARQVNETKNLPQVALVEELVQKVQRYAEESAAVFNEEAARDAQLAITIFLSLMGGVIVVGVVAAFIITRSITKPVSKLIGFAEEISQGNLAATAVAYEGRDEIGVLTNTLNEMRSNLQKMALAVTEAVAIVSSSSQEMSAGAHETSVSVEELASTANQFAGAVDRLSSNAQDMSASAAKTSELSQQGAVEIGRTVRTMTEINEVVGALAADIRDLGQQSEEIGQIVTLITGIADQTNLLALNAAIEAARAGEQGRGFAVVAEEVRKLAEQSARAAGEITELIHQVRDSAQRSVQNAAEGGTKVQQGMDVVTRSGEMFGEITDVIEILVREIGEVATATQQLAAGAEEMGATTEQQSASVQQMASTAQKVSEAAALVDEQIRQFKI